MNPDSQATRVLVSHLALAASFEPRCGRTTPEAEAGGRRARGGSASARGNRTRGARGRSRTCMGPGLQREALQFDYASDIERDDDEEAPEDEPEP